MAWVIKENPDVKIRKFPKESLLQVENFSISSVCDILSSNPEMLSAKLLETFREIDLVYTPSVETDIEVRPGY